MWISLEILWHRETSRIENDFLATYHTRHRNRAKAHPEEYMDTCGIDFCMVLFELCSERVLFLSSNARLQLERLSEGSFKQDAWRSFNLLNGDVPLRLCGITHPHIHLSSNPLILFNVHMWSRKLSGQATPTHDDAWFSLEESVNVLKSSVGGFWIKQICNGDESEADNGPDDPKLVAEIGDSWEGRLDDGVVLLGRVSLCDGVQISCVWTYAYPICCHCLDGFHG